MPDDAPTADPSTSAAPRWRPLRAIDRRVLGVLAEKAKTTPDIYPMSLNAIVTGCNQKSNRAPLMQLEADDVQESLDRLREMGAAAMVEGYGRVTKYRHYLYEWLGVEKLELSVMIELLLRGAQSEGDLRGRASRMDPIPDLTALRAILHSLRAKNLVVSLTPEGRGHMVTHALYQPRELEQLKVQYSQHAIEPSVGQAPNLPSAAQVANPPRPAVPTAPPVSTPAPTSALAASARESHAVEPLRREIEELRAQVAELRSRLDEMAASQQRTEDEVRSLREALGG
jgi:uncharacterized protein YceH (UPF0502 family)